MAAPFLLALHGALAVVGKRPDGDSMRFVPSTPEGLEELGRADRIRLSRDGSVQLRFEGIDAPETHYGPHAQPLGDLARDRLLELAGFRDVVLREDGTVTEAEPATRAAVVLAKMAEVNGRPVSYVLVDETDPPPDGEWTQLTPELVRRSLNGRMLEQGLVYLTLYASTPAAQQRTLARHRPRGATGPPRGVGGG